ncbi:MAG: pyruvate synthase subunit PorD [Candidatus Diapherotrites archaeon]
MAKENKTEKKGTAKPAEKLAFNLGAVIYEPGSTIKNKTGSWRSMKPKIDQAKCIKCGICWVNCPDMSVKKNAKGEFEIDYDYCKGCGICANECPAKAILMEIEKK